MRKTRRPEAEPKVVNLNRRKVRLGEVELAEGVSDDPRGAPSATSHAFLKESRHDLPGGMASLSTLPKCSAGWTADGADEADEETEEGLSELPGVLFRGRLVGTGARIAPLGATTEERG
jgi:hypothetical protein